MLETSTKFIYRIYILYIIYPIYVMPMPEAIEISIKEKFTTIRLKERTKRMLEALSQGKETHERIILRLIKLANQMHSQAGTEMVRRGRVTGTKYERSNRMFAVRRRGETFSIVCTFNDLTLVHMLRQSAQLRNYLDHGGEAPQWEIDLHIENVRMGKGEWRSPDSFEKERPEEFLLLYLACLKQLLEESFDIILYELSTEEDLLSSEKWDKGYRRNSLSRESFYTDVQRRLKEAP